MKKDNRQRLFEMMHRVNPDFILKEEETVEYSADELFLLYVLVVNLHNAHNLRNPEQTKDFIYNYNQKHGNVIEFPLVDASKDELTEKIADFLYGEGKATDDQLMDLVKMDSKEIVPLLKQRYELLRKGVKEIFMEKNRPSDDLDKDVDRILYHFKNDMEYYIRALNNLEKYKGFPSSKNSLNSNFYELFPVAHPTWTGEFAGERAINAMKSLVNKKAVIVIPFTEEEKNAMNEKANSVLDYLTPDWKYTKNGYAHVIVLDKDYAKISKQYNDYQINNFKFTKEYLNNLLTDSMEGGSNYWALFDHRFIAPQLADMKIPMSEKIIDSVWDYHKSIPVYDVESGEDTDKEYGEYDNPYENYEKLGELSMDSILEAVTLIKKDPRYQHIWENIATENYDAGDADVFFQLAIMGDVVYG